MNKRLTALFALLLVSLLLTSACALAEEGVPGDAAEQSRPAAGELTASMSVLEPKEEPSLANFSSVLLTGETVDSSLFADHKLTMVNIWATYCNPCIAEMPYLGQLHTDYEEGEFQVVGLVVDMLDSDGSIHPMAVEYAWMIIDATGAYYPHMLPSDDLILSQLQNLVGVPTTVFVDSQGNILHPEESYVGSRSYEDWKAIVDGLLAEPPDPVPTAAPEV